MVITRLEMVFKKFGDSQRYTYEKNIEIADYWKVK